MQIPMQMGSSESLLMGLLGWSMKQGSGPTGAHDSDLGPVPTEEPQGGSKP